MNKQYRIVWQEATQQWVVASELTQSHGPSTSVLGGCLRSVVLAFVLTPMAWAADPVPTQLPTGGQVVAGQAAISQSATVMNVDQTSQRAAIDWQSFNVGSAAQVNFNQPNSSSVTLNRVLDNNPSQIFGRITAPGQVFLVNPAGAYFAPSASVEVGGLMATTHSLSNEDFMAGRNTLVRNGATGRIVNEGQLKASLGGYIALLAPEVRNNGVVVAQMGTVALAAGEAYTLQFDGKGLLSNVVVTPATMKALVENGNAVEAPGGLIILSAQAASRLQGGIVNNTGSLQASGLVKEGGRILLRASDQINHSGSMQADAAPGSAGQGGHITLIADLNNPESVTRVSGSISAKGGVLGGDGGFIETSASHLGVSETAQISTAAPNGKGGEWLLDPADITISTSTDSGHTSFTPNSGAGASTVNTVTLVDALNNGNVTVTTANTGTSGSGAGNITVSADIAKTSSTASTLTLTANGSIIVNAPISSSSSLLNVTLNANGGSIRGNSSGTISTNGGLLILNAASGSGTLEGVISGGASSTNPGTGAVTKTGDGTVVLSGANTYSGLTTVSRGKLTAGVSSAYDTQTSVLLSGAFGKNSDVFITGGLTLSFLELDKYKAEIGVLRVNPGTVNLGSGTLVVNVTNTQDLVASNSLYSRINGRITGSGNLNVKSPTATSTTPGYITFVSAGSSISYTGTTTIGQNVTFGIGGTGSIVGTSAEYVFEARQGRVFSTSATGPIENNGLLLIVSQSDTGYSSQTFPNAISGTGNVRINTNIEIVFSGTNSYTGSTTITAGTLSVSNIGNVGVEGNLGKASSDAGNLVLGGGTLKYTGANASTDRLLTLSSSFGAIDSSGSGPLSFTNSGAVAFTGTAAARTLTLTGTNTAANEFKPIIGNSTVPTSLIKSGDGTWVLSGANSYSGTTAVNVGTLAITNAGGLGTTAGGTTVASTGTLDLQGVTVGTEAVTLSGGTLKVSSGTSSLSGTIALGANSTIDSALNTSLTLTGVISGTGRLSKTGNGTLTLTRGNNYSGETRVSAGTLAITNATGLGATTFGITVASGATLDLQSAAVGAEAVTLNGGTLKVSSGPSSLSGAITLGADSTIDSSATLTLTGGLANAGFQTTFTGTGSTTVSTVAISGLGGLTKTGNGTLALNGANTFSGTTNINAGSLILGHSLALQSSTLNLTTGGFSFGSMNDVTLGGLSGSSDLVLTSTATSPGVTLKVGNNNTNTLYSGILSGATGSLVKVGSGTLTLSGDNAYGGTTTISGGTLQVGDGGSTGSLGSGAVTNNSSLNFKRVDTIISNVISGSGSVLADITGDLTLAAGASVSSSANDIVLSATRNFFNYAGGSVLGVASDKRWIVYSTNPASNRFDDLKSGTKAVWGSTYLSPPTSLGTGNRYVFSDSGGTVTATTTATGKTYGDAAISLSNQISISLTGPAFVIGNSYGVYLSSVQADALSDSPSVSSSGNTQAASAGPHDYTVTSPSVANGFVFALVNNARFTVDPKKLTYVGATTTVTYNATQQSANNTYVLTGVVSSDRDNVSLSASTPARGTSKGTYYDTVTSLSGTASGNYELASTGNTLGSLVIDAKKLTYVGGTSTVTYNATQQSANNTYVLTGVVSSDRDNVSLSASTPASGTSKGTYYDTVTNLSGTASGNYELASTGNTLGSLVIDAKKLNYVGATSTVTYNAVQQSASNTYQLTGVIASDADNVSLSASTPARGISKGTYYDTVTNLSGTASGNYELASTGNTLGSLVIDAKKLNYVGATSTVTYNAVQQSASNTYQLTGVIASDADNVSLSASTPARGISKGTYYDTVTNLSGTASGNYELASTGNTLGSLVIDAKKLTYVGGTSTVTYNATQQSANNTYVLTGVVSSDRDNVSLSASTPASGTSKGTYYDTVTNLSGTASGNYELASTGNTLGSLVIDAKKLTYVGGTSTVTYNATQQSANNTYVLTGVVSSDRDNVSLSASTPASGTSKGTYYDTVTNLSGTASGNYELASTGNTLGSLVIDAKKLTYVGGTSTVTYNATQQSANNTYVLTGVIATDRDNVSLSASTPASGTSKGTYYDTVTSLSGTASGNYELASTGNTLGSLVIDAKKLNYVGATSTVTYNAVQQSASNTYQLTGVIASDADNVSLSASTPARGISKGTYYDTVTNLSGTASGNYELASTGNTLGSLVIDAKKLTYVGGTSTVTYNATQQSANNTYVLTGVIASDDGKVSLSASTPASGTSKGTYYDKVTSLSGTASGNYELASTGNTLGSLVIDAKKLTYVGGTSTVTYNATQQSANNTYVLTGVIATDRDNVSLSASTPARGTSKGTYYDTVTSLSGTASGNYELASTGNTLGSLVIDAKKLNYVGATSTVTYNAVQQSASNTYQLTGVIASDADNVSLSASTPARGISKGTYYDTVTNLSGTASGNYELASTGNTLGSLVIDAKKLNYVGATSTVTYNAVQQSASNTYQLTGVIASDADNVSLSASTPARGISKGTYYDTVTNLSGTASGNYELASTGNTLGSLVIDAKKLTYVGGTSTVTYNATQQSANNTYVLTGVVSSDRDNVSLSASTPASGTSKGTYYDTVTNLSGTASGNYELASTGNTLGSLVIDAKKLTYVGGTSTVTYNATQQSANNTYVLTGVVSSDRDNVSLSASTPASGTSKGTYYDTVTSLSGTASGNYELASTGNTLGSLVIDAKKLNYVGATSTVTYNAVQQSASNTYQLTGVIASDADNVSLSASTPARGISKGTYYDTVTNLSGTASGNYELASTGNTLGSLVIDAKKLTYVGGTSTVTYNATQQSANNTYVLTGVIASDDGKVSLSASTPASGTSKGTYYDKVTSLSGTASGNYELASTGNTLGSLVIDAKKLTYVGGTSTVTYNATQQSANNTYVLTGVIATDRDNVSLSASTPARGTSKGTYYDTVTSLSGTASGNYELASTGNTLGSLVIDAKKLNYVGATSTVTYNATQQSANNTYVLTGVVSSDRDNVSLSASTPARGTSKGTYYDTVTSLSGAASGNYELASTGNTLGSLVISPKILSLSDLKANNKPYDGTTTATIATFGNLLGNATSSSDNKYYAGDSVELVTTNASASFADPNAGTNKTVTVKGLTLSNSNYTLAEPTTTASITSKSLYLLAITGSRRYNGTTLFTYKDFLLTGDVNNEGVTLTAGSANTPSPNVGTYTDRLLSGLVISVANGSAANYTLPTTANLTITPANLTIAGVTAASKVYDGTRLASLSGGAIEVFGNDNVTLVKTNAIGSFDTKDVGTAKPVTASGYALSGADNGNYNLIQPTGLQADITPKALRIVANNDARTYDSVAYSGGKGVTYSGFVAGESETVLSGVLVYAGTSQGAVNVGTYMIQPKGLTSRNYSLGFEDGQLSIVAAAPVVPVIAQLPPVFVPLDRERPKETEGPDSRPTLSTQPKPTAAPAPASSPTIVIQGRLTIIAPPQETTVGLATLRVNQALPAPGQTIQIPMPQELRGASQATVSATELPSWLGFDPLLQVFIVRSVPLGVETIEVNVQVDGRIWKLTLDFRNN